MSQVHLASQTQAFKSRCVYCRIRSEGPIRLQISSCVDPHKPGLLIRSLGRTLLPHCYVTHRAKLLLRPQTLVEIY